MKKILNIFKKKQKQQRVKKEEPVCNICGHTKSEHTKFGDDYPQKCLVKGCFCTRFQNVY